MNLCQYKRNKNATCKKIRLKDSLKQIIIIIIINIEILYIAALMDNI